MSGTSTAQARCETTSLRSQQTWQPPGDVRARPEHFEWYELCAAGRSREAAVRVAERIDRHLRHRDLHAIETIFDAVDPAKLSAAICVGLIAWTKPVADQLATRPQLVERVRARLVDELGVERADALLTPAR